MTRSYVTNLKRGRIEHPGMDRLGALASAMGFPPELWFGDEEKFEDGALLAALKDPTARSILEESLKLGIAVGMQVGHEDHRAAATP